MPKNKLHEYRVTLEGNHVFVLSRWAENIDHLMAQFTGTRLGKIIIKIERIDS